MRSLLLALLLVHVTGLSGCAAVPARADRPMFKGVELYSWLDPATQSWRFALLPGTNRYKAEIEIRGSHEVAHSVSDLKGEISQLAPSEQIFWEVREAAGFVLPPAEVVDGIIRYAASVGVTIQVLGSK